MLSKISTLPGPLKAVVWLNIVSALLAAIAGLASLTTAPATEVLSNLGSAVIAALVVVGILQKSKLVRMLVLIFSWIGIVLYAIGFVFGLVMAGLIALFALIPLSIAGVTVWGLMAAPSKRYFGIRTKA